MALSASVAEYAIYRKFDRQNERAALQVGAECFVSADPTGPVYEVGRLEKLSAGDATVTVEGSKRTVPVSHVFPKLPLGEEGVEDMVRMEQLHEPSLLENLEIRFRQQRIYTYVGSVLVSVNPYKSVPIYTPAVQRMYDAVPVGALPPHVYALADAAYQSARSEGKNQSILISGESGAGKTEAAKLIIAYLTVISGRDKAQTGLKVSPQERLLSSNPILEAFGNARTGKNNNSSRFAKMMDVQFDSQGYIVGGRIENYLLEKSRIVRQTKQERNYHAFYYLLSGCDKTERAVWGLYDAKHYTFTNQSRVYDIPGVNSKLMYTALKRAMTTGGITVHEQHLTFTLLAAVLHLGNVRFGGGDDESGAATVKNPEVVKWVAHLLKCDTQLLTRALLFRPVEARGETVELPLSARGASETRDTLAKELYSRCFDWIVRRLNEDMGAPEGRCQTMISLLDIFGFEQFETNAFEQFCINYANERLQFEFNEFIFKREKEEYAREQLDLSDFTFVDNQPALQLIELQPGGLLSELDSHTAARDGEDQQFLAGVLRLPAYQRSRGPGGEGSLVAGPGTFVVAHYAGEVAYTAAGFVGTNRERFSHLLLQAIRSSRIEHVVSLFSDMRGTGTDAVQGRASLSAQFRGSLIALMEKLGRAEPQYVRTIKPNGEQSSEIYSRPEMLRQLRCAGILETVRIRKEGFPYRRPLAEFLARYAVVEPGASATDINRRIRVAEQGGSGRSEDSAAVNRLLGSVDVSPKLYRIGLTKVFVKDELWHRLEGLRASYFGGAAVRIQAHFKGFHQRRQHRRRVEAARQLQAVFREYLRAVDVGDAVAERLKQLASAATGSRALEAVRHLGEMAARRANVDTIVQKGGVERIVTTLDRGADTEILAAGTEALDRMADSKESHSKAIARSGAVSTMVKNINVRHSHEDQPHAVKLLGNLSRVEKNVGIVVREGGLQALAAALARATKVDVISDTQVSASAKALGHLSRSKRVADAIGRDTSAIKAVIDGINAKPKYARLTQYSVGCLANMAQSRENVDTIVELGGAQTLVTAMRYHHANEDVLEEVGRTVRELAKNVQHAKLFGDLGAVEQAVASLSADPAHCGRPSLEIVDALVGHPANAARFADARGVSVFLDILRSSVQSEPVLTATVRILDSLCHSNPRVAAEVVSQDGPRAVLDSLTGNTGFVQHNTYCFRVLTCLSAGQADPSAVAPRSGQQQGPGPHNGVAGAAPSSGGLDGAGNPAASGALGYEPSWDASVVRDGLRNLDVVAAVSMSMERHSHVPEHVESGRQALEVLSERPDLVTAMDQVARSRMKSQTEKNQLETGRAIVVVGSLALLGSSVEYIIAEGGTPVLLAVVNGTSVNVSAKVADQVLVPALRALSRLLTTEDHVNEFVAEGGVPTLVAAIRGQSDKERVCEVTTQTVARLVDGAAGFRELVEQGGLEALIGILHDRAEFERVILTVLALLTSMAKGKAQGIRLLLEKGVLQALTRVIQHYQGRAEVLLACSALLAVLSTNRRTERPKLLLCGEWLLNGVRANPTNAELVGSTLRFVSKLSRDVDGIEYLQEHGAAEALLLVLEHHVGTPELVAMSSQVLGQITGRKELTEALQRLEALTARLRRAAAGTSEPADCMNDMVSPSALVGAMAPDAGSAAVLVEADAFRVLREALKAVVDAPGSESREKLARHLAVATGRLGQHRQHTKALLFSGIVQELIRAAARMVEYEDYVVEALEALESLSRNGQVIGYLIDIGSAPGVSAIVAAHPLNDQVLLLSTRFVTRLARGADLQNLPAVRKEGTALALIGVGRFVSSSERNLLDSLGSLGRLAVLTQDGSRVVLSREAVALLHKVLVKHRNSPAVVSAVCHVLACLGLDEPGLGRLMVTDGLLAEVVGALEQYGADQEELAANALLAMHRTACVAANAPALAERGVASAAMEALAAHPQSEKVQAAGLMLLAALAALGPAEATGLADAGAVRLVFNGVRAMALAPQVVAQGIAFAGEMARGSRALREGLQEERARDMVEWAVRAYPQNAELVAVCRKTYATLLGDSGEAPEQLMTRLEAIRDGGVEAAGAGGAGAGAAPELGSEQGAVDEERVVRSLVSLMKVVKNPSAPAKALSVSLMSLAGMRASAETLGEAMKHGGLARLVVLLGERADDLTVLVPLLKVLLRIADSPPHIHQVVAFGGIGALIRAMRAHLGVPDVLAIGVRILGHYSQYNRLKVLIGLYGGIPLLLEVMEKYVNIAPLLNKCAYTLGNLASNCLPNRKAIAGAGGVQLISFSMQKHRSYLELVVHAARALSPLCTDDDEARKVVATGGGSLVLIGTILSHPDHPGLLQNGLNCIHKIARRTDVIPTLIHQEAVQAVTASVRQFPENAELAQFGMEILSSLSGNQTRETAAQLTKGGTIETVVAIAMRHRRHERIQVASFRCLCNLVAGSEGAGGVSLGADANDDDAPSSVRSNGGGGPGSGGGSSSSDDTGTKVVRLGFVPHVLEAMGRSGDPTPELLEQGVGLLSALAGRSEHSAQVIIDAGAPEVLVELMRQCAAWREVVRSSLVCLAKLSTNEAHAQRLADRGCVGAVAAALLDRSDDHLFLTDALRVLVNLAILEQNAIAVSETATDPLLRMLTQHQSSQPFLRMFMLLLVNVSMWPRASQHLIDRGFVPALLDTMRAVQPIPSMLVRIVKVLTNFTMCGEAAKRLLMEEGAMLTVQEAYTMHRHHVQLSKAAEQFVFKMTGVRRRHDDESQQASEDAKKDLTAVVNANVSTASRNLLTGGTVMVLWLPKGKSARQLFRVTPDYRTLEWYDPKARRGDPPTGSLLFKFVKEIRSGCCTANLLYRGLFAKSKAVPECSFAVLDMRFSQQGDEQLSVEADSAKEASNWITALQSLKDAHKIHSVGM